MSRFAWAISIIAVVVAALSLWIKNVINKITYTVSLKNISVLEVGNTPKVRIDLSFSVLNKNTFGFTINSLYYEVYYKGRLIAKSADNSINIPIAIKPNGESTLNQSIEVSLDASYLDIIKNYVQHIKDVFTINLVVELFGIKIPLKGLKVKY